MVPQIQQQYHPLGTPDVNTTLNKIENITKNFFKNFILFLLKSNFEKGNFGKFGSCFFKLFYVFKNKNKKKKTGKTYLIPIFFSKKSEFFFVLRNTKNTKLRKQKQFLENTKIIVFVFLKTFSRTVLKNRNQMVLDVIKNVKYMIMKTVLFIIIHLFDLRIIKKIS